MRHICVDTETTGISPAQGHRIVEIACIEVIDGRLTGREFHRFINPGRPIPLEASNIHGVSDKMVQDKPFFAGIADELMIFVSGGNVVMHNAPFDVGFFQSEFEHLGLDYIPLTCLDAVIDTLPRFRSLQPGARCTLSALCERYGIELHEGEEWHGALTDARMLARLWQACKEQLSEEICS